MITIRQAQFDDFEAIVKLSDGLFRHSHQLSPNFNLEWSYGTEAKELFARAIVGQSSFMLLAEIDHKVVGYLWGTIEELSYRAPDKFAVIVNLFVDELSRKQGVGRRLVQEFIKLAKPYNPSKLRVESGANNQEAIDFYKSLGLDEFSVTLEKDLD